MMVRSFSSDNSELAVLPGAIIFLSLNFATATGSKSANTSLHQETYHNIRIFKELKNQKVASYSKGETKKREQGKIEKGLSIFLL